MFVYPFFLFLFGLYFGSFLNVVIDRLPRKETIVWGRSHCEFCNHPLFWYDLIPLLSFLMLSGKCRYCKKFIGWKYPVIETVTAVLFSLGAYIPLASVASYLQVLFYLFTISCLIVIFFIDLTEGIIPDIVLLPLGTVVLINVLLFHGNALLYYFVSAIGAFAFFLSLALITRGKGMGFGDVKFALLIGLLLGWPGVFVSLYIAFLAGAVAALILVAGRKKKFLGGTIPFGPFLVLGTIISWFWGDFLWQQLLHFLSF